MICEMCGSQYQASYVTSAFESSRASQVKTKYCSPACRNRKEKERMAAVNAAKPKKGPFVAKPIKTQVLEAIRRSFASGKSLIEIKDVLDRLEVKNQLNRQFSLGQLKRIVAGQNE